MMTDNQLIESLRQLKKELRGEGFIIDALTGSFARGEATQSSDIDLLYHIDERFVRKYGGFVAFKRLEELKNLLRSKLGRPVDLIAINNLSDTATKEMLEHKIDV
jgi:predicted nucleotidyltransferase